MVSGRLENRRRARRFAHEFRYTTDEAVMNTTTVARALTSSSFIRVRISFRAKQQVAAPVNMVRNRPIPCN